MCFVCGNKNTQTHAKTQNTILSLGKEFMSNWLLLINSLLYLNLVFYEKLNIKRELGKCELGVANNTSIENIG